MQNHNSVNTTDFVSLEDGWDWEGWTCGSCGCANSGCNACRNCGCAYSKGGTVRGNGQKAGAQGTVWGNADKAACETGKTCSMTGHCAAVTCNVAANDRAGSGCNAPKARGLFDGCAPANARSTACAPCNDAIPAQQVMPCPANTYVRPAETCTACQTANTGMNGACSACQQAPAARPCNPCTACRKESAACPCENASAANAAVRNQGVGMVYAVKQRLGQVFDSESALRSGTLFPELHKPMNGYCPGNCNCANPEQMAAFSIWDLRLYLDTHPDDAQAQALFRRLTQEADEENYATAFLPDDDLSDGWDWTQDPWPWNCRPCGQ